MQGRNAVFHRRQLQKNQASAGRRFPNGNALQCLSGRVDCIYVDVKEIERIIETTSEELEAKIDWTSAWGKKYPILLSYQNKVNTANYAARLSNMLDELKDEYGYNELDAMLVLKDILAKVWKGRKG